MLNIENPMDNFASNKQHWSYSIIESNCQHCKELHLLRNCPMFLERTTTDRIHIEKISKTSDLTAVLIHVKIGEVKHLSTPNHSLMHDVLRHLL